MGGPPVIVLDACILYPAAQRDLFMWLAAGGVVRAHWTNEMAGNAEKAIEHLLQALRISPRDPTQFSMHLQLSQASLCIGQYANGVAYALLGIGEAPGVAALHAHLAANHVGLGEIAKARAALEEARRVGPRFVERGLAGGLAYHKPEHLRRVTSFLRIAAGLEDPSAAEAQR